MQYWILQHSPQLLPENIPWPAGISPNRDYWHISRYDKEVRINNIAFIWHAGTNRGIYNVAIIVSAVPPSAEAERQIIILQNNDDSYWTDSKRKRKLRQCPAILIDNQYTDGISPPILVQELCDQGFNNLPILQMPLRGIYRLEDEVGARLRDYITRTRPLL